MIQKIIWKAAAQNKGQKDFQLIVGNMCQVLKNYVDTDYATCNRGQYTKFCDVK